MKLQQVIWPQDGVCTEDSLYFHTNQIFDDKVKKEEEKKTGSLLKQLSRELQSENKVYVRPEGGITIERNGKASFDTYFNGVSIEKWKKYTVIGDLSLKLEYKGDFLVRLCNKQMLHDEVLKKVLLNQEVHSTQRDTVSLSFGNADKGMLYFEVISLSDNSTIYNASYTDDQIAKPLREVKIGIDICTFKREKFVANNLELLNKNIIQNPDSPLYGHLEVFVSDNGKSLDIEKLSNEHIHIVQNKNTGGAGGFTRGLIEMIKDGNPHGVTHPLIMDDDIVIDTESLVKTYRILSLLKEEYKDAFIGGSMLRIDKQYMQVESGASWNAGNLITNKGGLDMRNCWNCLYNEVEEYTEYNAWWYCCFPIDVVSEENLPLPIFIRGDDVEYGVRNMKHLILMNGICVWHEPFENKYSSFLEYYIIRNRLIDNTYHFPNWGKKQLKKAVWGQWRRECKFYRYKNIDLHTQGVKDYLKGIDFLLETDGEELHKKVMAAGYKAVPVDQIHIPFNYSVYDRSLHVKLSKLHNIVRKLTWNGYLLPAKAIRTVSMAQATLKGVWRAKEIMYYDVTSNKAFVCKRSWKQLISKFFKVLGLTIQIDLEYNRARKSYQNRGSEIKSIGFWNRYLELDK